jgi:hypothetical protein
MGGVFSPTGTSAVDKTRRRGGLPASIASLTPWAVVSEREGVDANAVRSDQTIDSFRPSGI